MIIDAQSGKPWSSISKNNGNDTKFCLTCKFIKNTIKAGGSTVRAQNVDWVMDGWSGWSGYPLDCYDH